MKSAKMIITIIVTFMIGILTVEAQEMSLSAVNYLKMSTETLCEEPGVVQAFRILAWVINIFKVLVPVILVITSMYSLAKAVLASDDKEVKKATETLITKFIVGVCIFFIPTLAGALFKYVDGYDKTSSQFSKCGACMFDIEECDSILNGVVGAGTGNSGTTLHTKD